MTYHTGFLYLGDAYGNPQEIVNEARTRANMQTAKWAGLSVFSDLSPNWACSTLAFEPCTMASNGTVAAWQTLNTAINDAPWYSSASPTPSTDALGFFVEEWTGLDGGHIVRGMTARGNPPYGAMPDLQMQGHRVMAVNLIAVGRSERGLNHLMRWLESALMATCSSRDMTSLWLREHCPVGTSTTQLEDGLVRLDDVVMIQGPTWESPPIEGSGCYVRRISFTLAAGNPCLHRVPGAESTNTATWEAVGSAAGLFVTPAAPEAYAGSSQRHSVTVTTPTYGMISPIVTITSTFQTSGPYIHSLPALRILGFVDRAGIGGLYPGGLERIGMITVDGLDTGFTLKVNCANGTAIVRNDYGDRQWQAGSSFLKMSADYDLSYSGRRSINFVNCSGGWVVVEPAVSGTAAIGGAMPYPAFFWKTSIVLAERFGCMT